ncbi:MAG: 16S rRNA (cytosine(1402)-N(4))-methyltransferase RsmH [Bacteroidales bacterium]
MSSYHTPVLLHESIDGLQIKQDGIYCDATLGGGGHTREILSKLGPQGRLIVFDKDQDALDNAPSDNRIILVHSDFKYIHNFVRYYGYKGVDGVLADLGVSSHQFDTGDRGFSFRFEAELDMRMNKLAKTSAKDVLNNYSEEELTKVFRMYGEIKNPKKAAWLICTKRKEEPIINTSDLEECLKKMAPSKTENKFYAKIYQALRIEVNQEMASLEAFLLACNKVVKPEGIISIITYHSLEDRMVKNFIRNGKIDGEADKDMYGKKIVPFEAINRKPISPPEEEIAKNKRARSAKLRIAKRVP